jgi:hypothetical protein
VRDDELDWLQNEARKSVREMRRAKRRRLGKGEELTVTDDGESDRRCSQMRRSLMSYFIALRWNQRERKREARDELLGFIWVVLTWSMGVLGRKGDRWWRSDMSQTNL